MWLSHSEAGESGGACRVFHSIEIIFRTKKHVSLLMSLDTATLRGPCGATSLCTGKLSDREKQPFACGHGVSTWARVTWPQCWVWDLWEGVSGLGNSGTRTPTALS